LEGKEKMEDLLMWERMKSEAKALGISWVEGMLKGFISPSRRGVPRGDRIGLAVSKRKAAYLMVLYPHTCSMNEIGKLTKTTEQTLWVYRIRPAFAELVEEAYKNFSIQIQNTIDHGMKNSNLIPRLGISDLEPDPHITLLHLIPFFNDRVYTSVVEWMTNEITKNNLVYIPLLFNLIKFSAFRRDKGLRGWVKNPTTIATIKITVQLLTALIADQRINRQEAETISRTIQNMFLEVLDALTQKKSRKKI
jgi:hypothetical protein